MHFSGQCLPELSLCQKILPLLKNKEETMCKKELLPVI